MKFIKLLNAIFLLILRTICEFFKKITLYVRQKLKYWGKLRFNYTVKISLNSTFEGANTIGDNTFFSGRMGYGTYLCQDCSITGNIGRFCSIAAEVKNSMGVHPITSPFVSTSPMFYSLRKQTGLTFAKKEMFEELKKPIEIGHDCWIGQRVFVVGGIKIGTGAVVLAGAVVTKDVPPYAIVGGVPAKILKYRYDEATISFLLQSEWWNRPVEWLTNHSEILCDINKFKEIMSNETIDHYC